MTKSHCVKLIRKPSFHLPQISQTTYEPEIMDWAAHGIALKIEENKLFFDKLIFNFKWPKAFPETLLHF